MSAKPTDYNRRESAPKLFTIHYSLFTRKGTLRFMLLVFVIKGNLYCTNLLFDLIQIDLGHNVFNTMKVSFSLNERKKIRVNKRNIKQKVPYKRSKSKIDIRQISKNKGKEQMLRKTSIF